MAEHIPTMRIDRSIENGAGRIAYALSREMLEALLAKEKVNAVNELPDHALRRLCHRAGKEGQAALLADAETIRPRAVAISVEGSELRSGDPGFRASKAFILQSDPTEERLYNPDLSAVDFELYLIDPNADFKRATSMQDIGTFVLHRALQPPSIPTSDRCVQ